MCVTSKCAIHELSCFDWIVFASAYGVEAFFKRLDHHGLDARALARASVASVGAQTTAALLERGIRADIQPEQFHTDALVKAFQKRKGGVRGRRPTGRRGELQGDGPIGPADPISSISVAWE